MSNPFDQKDSMYLVLMNNIGQYSLWPSYIDVPTGWQVVWGKLPFQAAINILKSIGKVYFQMKKRRKVYHSNDNG